MLPLYDKFYAAGMCEFSPKHLKRGVNIAFVSFEINYSGQVFDPKLWKHLLKDSVKCQLA